MLVGPHTEVDLQLREDINEQSSGESLSEQSVHAALRTTTWRWLGGETAGVLLHVPSGRSFLPPPGSLDEGALATLGAALPTAAPPRKTGAVTTISLNVVQDCNMRCTYCFAGEGDYGNQGIMDFGTAKRTVELFARGRPHLHIIFFGGEPLLAFQLITDIVAFCDDYATKNPCQFSYSLTTNGTLLNAERIAFLREHHFQLTISYDGKSLQAEQRPLAGGASSAPLLERKLENFAHGLEQLRQVRLRGTFAKNPEVWRQNIFETLTSTNLPFWVQYRSADAQTFTMDDAKTIITVLTDVVDTLISERRFAELEKLEPLISMARRLHRGIKPAFYCGAGTSYVSVSAEGEMYACHRLNGEKSHGLGSVFATERNQTIFFAEDFRENPPEPCRSCWMKNFCGGGCLFENRKRQGSPFTPDPVFCFLQDQEWALAGKVLRFLAQEHPESLPTKTR